MSRLKFEDIKMEVEKSGWKLLSTTYSNLKTDMTFQCPNGHSNYYSMEKWRKSHSCPICENNPLANVNIKPVKKKGYRILALDQASITSGWAIFDNKNLISYGKWISDGKHSTERIGQTKYWVASMIAKWHPDLITLEDIQLQKFKDAEGNDEAAVVTFKKLAHLQGVLKNYFFESGIPYNVVSPSTWRTYSDIKGKQRTDKKRNAQLKIKKIYDIQVTQDEADAILIGRWSVHNHEQTEMISFI